MSSIESEVALLVKTKKWSQESAEISARAGHRCEYCKLDFLASADNYKQWTRDHIIPLNADGLDIMENWAAACWTCNFRYKGSWDPRPKAGNNASRAELITAIVSYIETVREKVEMEVKVCRKIAGR